MKKTALLVATLTVMSVAAQNQPGQEQQKQDPSKSSQSQNQQIQSQAGQSSQGAPGQSQSSSASQQQPGQSSQASQGQPGQNQSSSATSRQQGQSASGTAAKSQTASRQAGQPMVSRQFIDFKVVDKQDKQIGTVEAIWDDQTGQPAFLAIKRQGGQPDALLVVPAQKTEVNRSIQTIRVPYEQQALQGAPTFKNEEDLDRQAQMRIVAFYRRHGYQDRQQQVSANRGAQDATERDQATITLKEEELKVGTRQVDAGGILLKKVVRTDQVSKPVELQREEIVIERVEGTGRPVKGEIGSFEEGQIYIPLRREEAVVEKDARVKEVINVGKETQTERKNVSDQVREEQLQIIKEQGTDVKVEGQNQTPEQRRQQEQQRRQQQNQP